MDFEFLFGSALPQQDPLFGAKAVDLAARDELQKWDYKVPATDLGVEDRGLEEEDCRDALPEKCKDVLVLLEWWRKQRDNYRTRIQVLPLGWFNRYDIQWETQRISGGNRVQDTAVAIIPWKRLQDFVDGEENMRDFPCKINKRKWRECPLGSTNQPRKGSASITYMYATILPGFLEQPL